jgi:hypothetical protein
MDEMASGIALSIALLMAYSSRLTRAAQFRGYRHTRVSGIRRRSYLAIDGTADKSSGARVGLDAQWGQGLGFPSLS